MTSQHRDVQRKIKVLRHAEQTGCVAKTCRYFGIGRASFYRWRSAHLKFGEAGLINAKPIPKNPVNWTPPEIADKVLHLRSTYHLGPIRIVWYLARYHDITISEAGVSRILKRNGVSRLPRGTRVRKIHTKRYNKQVPGHHIQMDEIPNLRRAARRQDPTFPIYRDRRCNTHPGAQGLRQAYPGQCDRFRRSHHQQISVSDSGNSHRQRSRIPGQISLAR